ncbi:substrate-binding domain-containing protein [Arthrobacter sp. D2-10]
MGRSVTERRQSILHIVEHEGAQSAKQLAERLNVSAVTLRRDVEELAAQGLVQRTHGAVAPTREPLPLTSSSGATIGLVLPHSTYYYDGIITGAKAAAAAAGAKLVLGVSDYDRAIEVHQVQRLIAKGIDGLIIAPTPDFESGQLDSEQQQWLVSLEPPVVLVERPVCAIGEAAVLDSISSSHRIGAALAVRHLSELGHRQVACLIISGPNSPQVLSGFKDAADAAGLKTVAVIREGTPGSDDAAEDLLRAVKDGATALFVHNDQLAVRCIMWLEDAGIEIPGDVSLIGYDDVIAGVADIPLTALAPSKHAVGYRAVQRVLTRIKEGGFGNQARPAAERLPTEHVELVPRLHVRQSTSGPRSGGERTSPE